MVSEFVLLVVLTLRYQTLFNRRLFLALAIGFLATSSSAFASGGAKKDSTIKVVNLALNPVYAFVDVPQADINAAVVTGDVARLLPISRNSVANKSRQVETVPVSL